MAWAEIRKNVPVQNFGMQFFSFPRTLDRKISAANFFSNFSCRFAGLADSSRSCRAPGRMPPHRVLVMFSLKLF